MQPRGAFGYSITDARYWMPDDRCDTWCKMPDIRYLLCSSLYPESGILYRHLASCIQYAEFQNLQ